MNFLYQNCCKKCGSVSLHTEIKGSNIGLYCDDCGAWVKWLGKEELRAFEHSKKNQILVQMRDTAPDKLIIQRLNEFVEFLDRKINSEYEKLPLSTEDAIRKNSYCLALEQDKRAIQNILNGYDFNYVEELNKNSGNFGELQSSYITQNGNPS